jgi:membrane protease YdiL (CAAX protease family)
MATLAVYQYFRRRQQKTKGPKDKSVLPNLLSAPTIGEAPWKAVYQSTYSQFTSFWAFAALVQAYFWTGRFSIWWEDTFFVLGNYYPITTPMHRALCVLMGHLSWVAIGALILRYIPRPQNFFKKWYVNKKDTQWLWWTMGGYFVSQWFFNIADTVNQYVLPVAILEQASESVVSQLINPEFNDIWASLAGYIAPCISAPWWEEVLYRGFLLPGLVLQMPYKWAVFSSGIIFSVHHMSPTAFIPLAVLGWTWNILYTKSGNLFTTILIHAMWNSRVFLGSWLGL